MSTTNRFDPSYIVGGQVAPSPIPWQAAIHHENSFICGASILDAFSLLSAAHCFYGKNLNDSFSIRAGSIEKSYGGQVKFLICDYKLVSYSSKCLL